MKIFINQEHSLLPDYAFGSYVCCENCMSDLFTFFVLNLSKSGNILFRLMPNGNCLFNSASLSLLGDNSLVRELMVRAVVEQHVNATYYTRHLVLKLVYFIRKSQSVMGRKLISFYYVGEVRQN